MRISTKIIIILLFPICVSAQKFNLGTSLGLITIDKNNGFNGNLFIAYQLNDNISIGADALIGTINKDLKINANILYLEAGNPKWSLDNKHIVYFSGTLGLGNIVEKINANKENVLCFYAGTKVNINIDPKFIFGLKSGFYFSKFEKNPIIANLFFAYKF